MPTQPKNRRPASPPTDSRWVRRRGQPGWLLLPLRGFLGLTFIYAGLQKIANPDYLDPHSPTSVAHQMQLLYPRSPIGPLMELSMHAPTFVGLLIAFGELAVGLGTLLGLWTRVAAVGGALLALTFFLTVSWSTTPYYYGADIVFVFAWLVMFAFGSGGVLSVDGWLRDRARRDLGLGSEPAIVGVSVPRLRALCARGAKCGLGSDGFCTRLAGCPVFPVTEQLSITAKDQLTRRTLVVGGAAAGAVGGLALLIGGATAALGRAVGGTRSRPAAALGPPPTSDSAATSPSNNIATSSSGGTAILPAASLAVGHAHSFTSPVDGGPAWVVHVTDSTFVAFSAVCTHAGCPVQYDQAATAFVCPCHGGAYDARTGKVLQGPPPSPLPSIPVHVNNGQIQVGN
jgi:thiosulfate dehydrogenase [quinone] large subunit